MFNDKSEKKIKELIIEIVNDNKIETVRELISAVQEIYPISKNEILVHTLSLKRQKKIFLKNNSPAHGFKHYIFSNKVIWYWSLIFTTLLSVVVIFICSEDFYPAIYLRNMLGIIFLLFLPGYSLIKALIPNNLINIIERLALSLGFSIVLISIIGLALNYTPWGVRITSISLSTLTLIFLFSTVALVRQYTTQIQ